MARLIGSPPGYVGHEQGGQLTTALTACPDAVVLLDEVEKAHPDVLNIMLQVFDEGRLTDGKGQTISCPKAIFIMTSNLVQDEIRDGTHKYALRPPTDDVDSPTFSRIYRETQKFIRHTVQPVLKKHFKRDEFLGRINEMLIFHPFSDEDLRDIVDMELMRWADKAMDRHGMKIEWSQVGGLCLAYSIPDGDLLLSAVICAVFYSRTTLSQDVVAQLTENYDERYGFRSIKYGVEKQVINVLAAAHETQKISEGCGVKMALEDKAVVLSEITPGAGIKKEEQKAGWFRK